MTSEFAERVATFSIHPEQSRPREVAELAAEYMDLRRILDGMLTDGTGAEAVAAAEVLKRHER